MSARHGKFDALDTFTHGSIRVETSTDLIRHAEEGRVQHAARPVGRSPGKTLHVQLSRDLGVDEDTVAVARSLRGQPAALEAISTL
ncbi:hypothetical protein BJM39_03100 [Salmonella enterica subsp. enterica serovar Javiana]|nr:hypothetical protein BJM39_03100 [Salmonella enterica subsp. enterica serovar Javiana]